MKVWSLVSQKGGSGKTTLAINLGLAAQSAGSIVSIIDLDPQRSSEQWSELREKRNRTDEPTIVHGTTTNLDAMLAAARETGTDLMLIDTPPAVDRSMIFAAAASDLVIVPTRCDVFDEFSLRETLEYLKRIGMLRKTVVVLNAPSKDHDARARIARMVTEEYGARMASIVVEDLLELAVALRQGKGVVETAPRRKPAKLIRQVFTELEVVHEQLAAGARKSA